MNDALADLIKYYGSQVKLARALGVHRVAVSQWCDLGGLPPLRAIQVESLTGGKFKAVELYVRENNEK